MDTNLAFQEDIREEMLNGRPVLMSPRPTTDHNRISFNIAKIFDTYLNSLTPLTKKKDCAIISHRISNFERYWQCMNYTELAIQLVDMRASAPQIKMERTMSQIARGEILALNYLAANGNRAYPKDMSKALMLTTARIAAILKSLEGQEMITRTTDPTDSRQVIVCLTEKGVDLVEERRTDMISLVAKMLEALGEEDAKAYVRIQTRLIELGDIWR